MRFKGFILLGLSFEGKLRAFVLGEGGIQGGWVLFWGHFLTVWDIFNVQAGDSRFWDLADWPQNDPKMTLNIPKALKA